MGNCSTAEQEAPRGKSIRDAERAEAEVKKKALLDADLARMRLKIQEEARQDALQKKAGITGLHDARAITDDQRRINVRHQEEREKAQAKRDTQARKAQTDAVLETRRQQVAQGTTPAAVEAPVPAAAEEPAGESPPPSSDDISAAAEPDGLSRRSSERKMPVDCDTALTNVLTWINEYVENDVQNLAELQTGLILAEFISNVSGESVKVNTKVDNLLIALDSFTLESLSAHRFQSPHPLQVHLSETFCKDNLVSCKKKWHKCFPTWTGPVLPVEAFFHPAGAASHRDALAFLHFAQLHAVPKRKAKRCTVDVPVEMEEIPAAEEVVEVEVDGTNGRKQSLGSLFDQMDVNLNGTLDKFELQAVLGSDKDMWVRTCGALAIHLEAEFGVVESWDGDVHGGVTKENFVEDIWLDSEDMLDEQFKFYWTDKLAKNIKAAGLSR